MLAMRHKKAISAETRKRYAKATKREKTIILDKFTAITGYNRCYVSQILSIKKEKVLGYITTGTSGINSFSTIHIKSLNVSIMI